MKVISLGWGVQSFTLAAMVALGELESIDAAIHSDTTHERYQTYDFARRWSPWLEAHGVRVVTTYPSKKKQEGFITFETGIHIPAYTDTPHSGGGRLHRQCTGNWKIDPIRKWLQSNREGQQVEMWLGISLDEFQRMKPSSVNYVVTRWPLIDKRMTRNDCEKWLKAHGLEVPVKSSCVFCPFHNMAAWRELKQSGNGDWEKAVEVDCRIRKARPPYDLFIHPSRKPLSEVDLRTPQEKGQLELWANWDEECTGICGV